MQPDKGLIQKVGAIVLAAGQSRRMGQPKMVLPWGRGTVIEHVVGQLVAGGIGEIVVVTGGARAAVETALSTCPVKLVHNPAYDRSEMLASLQAGIRALGPETQAMLVVLGDQPTIESEVVRQVAAYPGAKVAALVIPSYQMRRGHPWLVGREFWDDLLGMGPEQTMRDFLRKYEQRIAYIQVDTPG
ncbi:MAG: nucleotidyltransferase family protein, partial [Chloroflexi bacterium]